MARGIIYRFPGGTKERFEASIASVHPGSGRLPKGEFYHTAGASVGGWPIVILHDFKENWERFRDEIFMS